MPSPPFLIESQPVPIVDSQIHLWEDADSAPVRGQRFLYSEALRQMDAAGVDIAVNCPPIWDAGSMDYAVAAHQAHPDRFLTHGWVDLLEPDAADRLAACLAMPGIIGLRFLTASPKAPLGETSTASRVRWPSDGSLDWFWAAMAQANVPVAVGGGAILPHVEAAARAHPDLKITIDHFGAVAMPPPLVQLPGLHELAKLPNIAVKLTGGPGYFDQADCMNLLSAEVRRLYDAFGPERLFWGSDITRMSISWRECLTVYTEQMPWLSAEDLRLITGAAFLRWHGLSE